jgi:hypothetical protein
MVLKDQKTQEPREGDVVVRKAPGNHRASGARARLRVHPFDLSVSRTASAVRPMLAVCARAERDVRARAIFQCERSAQWNARPVGNLIQEAAEFSVSSGPLSASAGGTHRWRP